MEGTVYIASVPYIDKSCVITIESAIIEYPHPANSIGQTVPVPDPDIPDATYTSVKIIEYGDIFNLDHRTVVIILDVGVVIESGIEGNANGTHSHSGANTGVLVDKEIEFPIRVNGKGNSIFYEDE